MTDKPPTDAKILPFRLRPPRLPATAKPPDTSLFVPTRMCLEDRPPPAPLPFAEVIPLPGAEEEPPQDSAE